MNELYRQGQVGQQTTLPNPSLEAERATGFEFGALVGRERFGSVRGSYFWTEVNRPVAAVTLSSTPTTTLLRRQNLGQLTSKGLLVQIENGEAWLMQVNVSQYEQGNRNNADPDRRRKLLLHKREIEYLDGKVRQQGLTLVPLRMYTKGNRIKLLVGLARGKKLWDKRHDIAERDSKRESDRVAARH